MSHAELKEKLLANPQTLAAYQNMSPEFSLLRQMLKASRNEVKNYHA